MSTPAGQPSFHDSMRQLLAESVEVSHGRLELLVFELGDERLRLGLLLKRGAAVAISCFMALQLVVLFTVALVWDSGWRIEAMAGLLGLALLLAVLALRRFRGTPDSTLFEISSREFARDRDGITGS